MGYGLYKVSRPTEVIVLNTSTEVIHNITLNGNGFTINLGSLNPNESKSNSPTISGESGLEISFKMKDEVYKKDDLAYLEKSSYGYKTLITISDKGNITSDRQHN
ncbi:hypothetical protein PQO01_21115 [Lentisphaera marina]|uniref:hypothetical protein n=1 Tax=Lentisphaera marina TaxID=1111041 RepID=UPI002366D438|nr:hypothetical protein [Lentisphaera marina]MDD7987461.1 hypothetical protein [Lentisphaera marina]